MRILRYNLLRTMGSLELGSDRAGHQRVQAVLGVVPPGARRARDRGAGPDGQLAATGPHPFDALQTMFLYSRAETIYGGSNQIQRNIIGERALGLPSSHDPLRTRSPTSASSTSRRGSRARTARSCSPTPAPTW